MIGDHRVYANQERRVRLCIDEVSPPTQTPWIVDKRDQEKPYNSRYSVKDHQKRCQQSDCLQYYEPQRSQRDMG